MRKNMHSICNKNYLIKKILLCCSSNESLSGRGLGDGLALCELYFVNSNNLTGGAIKGGCINLFI